MNLTEEYRKIFKNGNIISKLILINLSVFVLVLIINALAFLFKFEADFSIVEWLGVPASLSKLLLRPWTIVTYMFLHEGFFHILFNMLWLYWLGVIFHNFLGERQLLTVYLIGGLAGAALYIFSFNVFPVFYEIRPQSIAMGASASVMAIIIGISVYKPDFAINLLLIGPVKLKYIAIFSIVIDIMMLPSSNAGGHIAHLGGALFGVYYIAQYKKGKDMSIKVQKNLDNIAKLFSSSQRSKMKVTYKRDKSNTGKRSVNDYDYNKNKAEIQKEIDRILDKISKSGYQSLTSEEKDLLFRQSNKL